MSSDSKKSEIVNWDMLVFGAFVVLNVKPEYIQNECFILNN